MNIDYTLNLPTARLPTKGTPGAAGFDLYAAAIQFDFAKNQIIVDIGISTSFDPTYVMLIFGRSGLAMKHGLRPANGVGVVDSDYRGPIKVILYCDQPDANLIELVKVGDRVAQAVFMPIAAAQFGLPYPPGLLPESVRGEGGFGSTGQ